MKTQVALEIHKPVDVVWPVLADVERWPEWTASMTEVRRLDSGPFGLQSTVRIRQPRLKSVVWRVSEFHEGRNFSWETRGPGVFAVARHELLPTARGTTVVLTVEQEGWLTPLLKLLIGRLTKRYMQMEAEGLKRRCEKI